jgi:hypothetical protein
MSKPEAAQRLVDDLSPQAWCDLAPCMSCFEAEAVHAFLIDWASDEVARAFMEAHALSDDPNEGDIH